MNKLTRYGFDGFVGAFIGFQATFTLAMSNKTGSKNSVDLYSVIGPVVTYLSGLTSLTLCLNRTKIEDFLVYTTAYLSGVSIGIATAASFAPAIDDILPQENLCNTEQQLRV